MINKKQLITVLIVLITIAGCKDKPGNQETSALGFGEKTEHREDIRAMYFRFPTSKEMINYIDFSDFTYHEHLLNPVSNNDDYFRSNQKMLNLGVYLSDIAYLALFEKHNQLGDYLEVILKSCDELRLEFPFQNQMLDRMKANVGNQDSLLHIAEEYQDKVIDNLLNSGREKTIAIVSTGGYIEGLYLALESVESFEDNYATVQRIAEQKYAFNNLMKFTAQYKDDVNAAKSLAYLEKIDRKFQAIKYKEKPVVAKKQKDQKLLIDGGRELSITREQFTALKETVAEARNSIITTEISKNEN